MPVVRLHYPKGALSAERKRALAKSLTEIALDAEVDTVTLPGRMVTVVHFDEVDPDNWSVGGELRSAGTMPVDHFIVDVYVLDGLLENGRRSQLHARVATAFEQAFGESIAARVWVLVHELPEGSWGAAGRTVSALEVAQFLNPDLDPKRVDEIRNACR